MNIRVTQPFIVPYRRVDTQAVPVPVPPPKGSVGIGELLIDAQSTRQWLGVAETVDEDMAILINDYIGLQAQIAQALLDAKAYADAGLATKANAAHTHTASQITDFSQAVKQVMGGGSGVPIGCILIWSGSVAAIGVGNLVGWHLCDGNAGTQNLMEKFVIGAGTETYKPGTSGGSVSATGVTNVVAGHAHTGVTGYHSVTVAEMPSHTHTVTDPTHLHYNPYESQHRHTSNAGGAATQGFGDTGGRVCAYSTTYTSSVESGIPYTGYSATGVYLQYTGSGYGHNHTLATDGAHSHTVTITGGGLPPYYALAYIQRIE